MSKIFGHSKVDTSLTHYIYPKNAINLTEQDIISKPCVDEFLKIVPCSMKLTAFFQELNQIPLIKEIGQRTLEIYCLRN